MENFRLLAKAVLENDYYAAKELLVSGVTAKVGDYIGKSLLMTASENGYYDIAELLIEYGAEVDRKLLKLNYTALGYASENGHIDIVKLLLKNGANPKIRYSNGTSPIMFAKQAGHSNIVSLLKEKGASR